VEPSVAARAAEKLAREDKAAFAKVHELVAAARADEREKEARLRANQKPNESAAKNVLARRMEIMRELSRS